MSGRAVLITDIYLHLACVIHGRLIFLFIYEQETRSQGVFSLGKPFSPSYFKPGLKGVCADAKKADYNINNPGIAVSRMWNHHNHSFIEALAKKPGGASTIAGYEIDNCLDGIMSRIHVERYFQQIADGPRVLKKLKRYKIILGALDFSGYPSHQRQSEIKDDP